MKKIWEKTIESISRVFHVIFSFYIPYALWRNSRRLKKWLKKNRKQQDPNLYSFSDRFEYIRRKAIKFNKRMGIKVNIIGLDNLPKSGSWITPNHTSNYDGFYLLEALGSKVQLVPTANDKVIKGRIASGFLNAADAFIIDRNNIRQALTNLNNAANYGRQNNRGVVVFPEGTRSFTTKLLEFRCGSFKFPQKYALPIVPITITGTLQAKRWWKLYYRYVNVTIHKPLKPIEHIKIPSDIVCRRVYEKINNELIKYEKELSNREKKHLEKLRLKAIKSDKKKERKLIIEKENFIKKDLKKSKKQ
ncbi:MAG: 1-acyl-sn-glycerol-3-phosphate acyltransferase [Candidatus Hepatoplasma vulgare]|nr:MAG: 1-acyl-sn-glycerol-3-phosphate acyltransferase [Candidatus Hepatoplasma sp.]